MLLRRQTIPLWTVLRVRTVVVRSIRMMSSREHLLL
jgi:hypothetical protein